MKNEKQVQITESLFLALCKYHLFGLTEEAQKIHDDLNTKLEARIRHDLYSSYKTAPTEAERETARQAYLENIGIPSDFRY